MRQLKTVLIAAALCSAVVSVGCGRTEPEKPVVPAPPTSPKPSPTALQSNIANYRPFLSRNDG